MTAGENTTAGRPVNLFLCAAPRSGSTQLAAWLATNPDIGIAAIKEPNYFAQHEFPEEFVRSVHLNDVDPKNYVERRSKKVMQFAIFREREHYQYLFRDLKQRWLLDASTTYLHADGSAQAIIAYNPDARVVILTRDPVSRALSHYRLALRTGRTTRPLAEELLDEYNLVTPLAGRFLLRQSSYEAAIAAYQKVFPAEQLLQLSFEDLVRNPQAALTAIGEFLNIDPNGFDTSVNEQNAGDAPRFGSLNVWLMKSGVKTFLRNAIPRPVKRLLKPIYFKNPKRLDNNADREMVASYLSKLRG